MVRDDVDLAGALLSGRYLLVAPIGRGGMGVVYRARDLERGGDVAIKVLSAGRAQERRQGDRFERELQAMRRVRHPHLVRVLDDGTTDDGHRWIAMELLGGTTLTRRIARSPLPAGDVEAIIRQVLGALQAIHEAGLVHRDLKPGNVMVEDTPSGPRARLLDLGIVRFVDPDPDMSALTAANKILGTPEYMAPELIQHGHTDARSDLYAAGILLFHMAAGRPPFKDRRTALVLRAHVHDPVPDLADHRDDPLPDRLSALLQALLRKAPEQRPATAAEALAILGGAPSPPVPRGLPTGAIIGLALGGAALVGVLVGVVLVVALGLAVATIP